MTFLGGFLTGIALTLAVLRCLYIYYLEKNLHGD